jgi:hypothetical protein
VAVGTAVKADSDHFGAALWPTEFPDGASKENIQSAIQLAWLAGDVKLGREIAERYGVFGRVCLRCATGGLSILPPNKKRPDRILYHLCDHCGHDEMHGPV